MTPAAEGVLVLGDAGDLSEAVVKRFDDDGIRAVACTPRDDAEAKARLTEDRWSGRLSEEKSPETFLELAARCRNLAGVHFVMTGGGRLAERIEKLAAQLPEGTRLHRSGLVDDMRPYYRLFDIFTLTSRLDGRPNAVMEAQASGCARSSCTDIFGESCICQLETRDRHERCWGRNEFGNDRTCSTLAISRFSSS